MQDLIPQIDAMRLGTNYRFPVQVRGFRVLLRPLAVTESVRIATDVADRVRKLPSAAQHRMSEQTILAMATLEAASTSDVDARDPQLSELIVGRMTNDELMAVWKEYLAGCDRCNPSLEELKPEDLKALVEDLKKSLPGGRMELAYQLTGRSFWELVNLSAELLMRDGSPADK